MTDAAPSLASLRGAAPEIAVGGVEHQRSMPELTGALCAALCGGLLRPDVKGLLSPENHYGFGDKRSALAAETVAAIIAPSLLGALRSASSSAPTPLGDEREAAAAYVGWRAFLSRVQRDVPSLSWDDDGFGDIMRGAVEDAIHAARRWSPVVAPPPVDGVRSSPAVTTTTNARPHRFDGGTVTDERSDCRKFFDGVRCGKLRDDAVHMDRERADALALKDRAFAKASRIKRAAAKKGES